METPVLAQRADHIGGGETERKREQTSATRIDVRDVFLGSQEESVSVLDAGATANLVCFSCLARHNRASETWDSASHHMSLGGKIPLWWWAPWGGTPCD